MSSARSIVITGASGGIGKPLARRLSDSNCQLLLIDPNFDRDFMSEMTKKGHYCFVGSAEPTRKLLKEIGNWAPRGVDGLVCLASVGPFVGKFRDILAVNYLYPYQLIEKLQSEFSDESSVVLTGSTAAYRSGFQPVLAHLKSANHSWEVMDCCGVILNNMNSHAIYSLSKKCLLDRFVEECSALAHKTRLNLVVLGVTETSAVRQLFHEDPQLSSRFLAEIPRGKFNDVSEVVEVVRWLLSRDSSGVRCSQIHVDGGWSAARAGVATSVRDVAPSSEGIYGN